MYLPLNLIIWAVCKTTRIDYAQSNPTSLALPGSVSTAKKFFFLGHHIAVLRHREGELSRLAFRAYGKSKDVVEIKGTFSDITNITHCRDGIYLVPRSLRHTILVFAGKEKSGQGSRTQLIPGNKAIYDPKLDTVYTISRNDLIESSRLLLYKTNLKNGETSEVELEVPSEISVIESPVIDLQFYPPRGRGGIIGVRFLERGGDIDGYVNHRKFYYFNRNTGTIDMSQIESPFFVDFSLSGQHWMRRTGSEENGKEEYLIERVSDGNEEAIVKLPLGVQIRTFFKFNKRWYVIANHTARTQASGDTREIYTAIYDISAAHEPILRVDNILFYSFQQIGSNHLLFFNKDGVVVKVPLNKIHNPQFFLFDMGNDRFAYGARVTDEGIHISVGSVDPITERSLHVLSHTRDLK